MKFKRIECITYSKKLYKANERRIENSNIFIDVQVFYLLYDDEAHM